MKTALVLAFLLTLSTPAVAQDRLAAGLFASAATADWITTYHNTAIRHGGEGNPTIKWLLPHPVAMIALGATIDAAGGLAWWKLTASHRRWRTVGFVAATGVRLYIAQRNMRVSHLLTGCPHQALTC